MHFEELNDLYASPHTIRVIKPRRMEWFGFAARMPERIGIYGVWWGNLREGDHFENPGVPEC